MQRRARLVRCRPWVLVVLAAGVGAAAADTRPIAETDLFRFVWVSDPRIAPDGRNVAFVRVHVDKKADRYVTAIWLAPADGSEPPRPFTNGPNDTAPRWSPDGRWLAFNRVLEQDGKPQPAQIWLLPSAGGEARALTDLPRAAGPAAWSPDGKAIAFTSGASDADLAKAARRKAEGKAEGNAEGERESDVRVVTRAVYRFNGRGYLDPARPSQVWTIPAARDGSKPKPTRITSGPYEAQNPAWAPGGSEILFVSTRVPEPYYEPPDSDLWAVPAAGGDPVRVASIDGTIGDFAPSPDGRRVAFEAVANARPVRSYNQPDLFVVERAGGKAPQNLTAGYDFDVGSGLTGDQRAPRGGHPAEPVWSGDGRSVVVRTTERGRANLMRIDVAGASASPLTRGDHELMSYTATPDAGRFALVVSTPTVIGDLHLLDAASGRLTRLTSFNDALFAELRLTAPEEINYRSFDGQPIHAWVQRPPGFEQGRRYPLILNVHGGPHAAYGHTFDHEFQWMAAKGYLVLYPNPRGSSAYGQAFGNLIQHRYPGDDHKDLMAGVDELIRRGEADPKRLGVTGGSGGGVLTNWAITQTDRFAAAVSQRSIADWAGFWYTADFTLFKPSWFKAAPFQDPKDFAARSPITHAARIRTPLMLIEGEADLRTPAGDGGEQMFRALKYLKRPVAMVRFPDESHELSRSGKPWHRVERLQHIVGWFDRYLLGEPHPEYDVP